LATVLSALDGAPDLSETRRRDLRSAVKRVAELLGNVPATIPLVMEDIQAKLAAVSPIGVSMTLKRFTNIRSDFVSAVKASGLIPLKGNSKAQLSPEWIEFFTRLTNGRPISGSLV
jgi:hypothetical protein